MCAPLGNDSESNASVGAQSVKHLDFGATSELFECKLEEDHEVSQKLNSAPVENDSEIQNGYRTGFKSRSREDIGKALRRQNTMGVVPELAGASPSQVAQFCSAES
jgi:hypothetical protein